MRRFLPLFSVLFVFLLLGLILGARQADVRDAYALQLKSFAADFLSEEKMAVADKPTPDRPDEAAFQEFIQTMDPALGRVPLERRMEAWRLTHQMRDQKGSKNVISGWTEIPSNMGGRTRALMYDPNDPTHKKVWAAGVTGGLWYTNDITEADSLWHPAGSTGMNLSVCALAFDPNNTQIMYAGTGEAQTAVVIYRESSGRGSGILRSTDGGNNWALMPTTTQFAYVTDIVVRSESGQSVIYAGVTSGKYKGQDHQSLPSDGLFRSTDGGLSWTQVLPNIPGTNSPYAPSDIEIAASGRIFVGTGPNINLDGGACILYSDLGTSGSWTVNSNYQAQILADPQYPLPGRVMLSSSASADSIVYAVIAKGYNNGFNYYIGGFLVRSLNHGQSWTTRNMPPDYNNRNWANLAWHAFTIGVDPNNPQRVWVGGLDVHRTTNGGQSWYRFSDWAQMYYGGGSDYVHADQHAIVFKPGSSTEILFASDGGVFRSDNGTASTPSFTERSEGMNTLQFYTGTIHPVPGSPVVMGGLQDNGTLLTDGNPLTIFSMVSGGDGAYCFFDEDESNIFLTSSQYSNYNVFVDSQYVQSIGANTGVFINPSAYDFKDNFLFMNKTSFFGSNLNKLIRSEGIPYFPTEDEIHLFANATSYFSHLTYSRHSAPGFPTLFAGTAAGRVFRISNAQALLPVVTEITGPQFPTAAVSCIAVGASEDTLLVTFSNYGVASVWQSTDGGLNWENKEGNLPDMPIRWAIYHPDNNWQALVATETGVWSTSNLNQSNPWWVPLNQGMPNVRVDMLQLRYSDLTVLASSHGRGLFTTTYLVDPFTGAAQESPATTSVYPNPSSGLVYLPGEWVGAQYQLLNLNGQLVEEGKLPSILDLSDCKPGTYVLQVEGKEERISHKLILK